jgi:capsular exopolysaccharide synthesis family protein
MSRAYAAFRKAIAERDPVDAADVPLPPPETAVPVRDLAVDGALHAQFERVRLLLLSRTTATGDPLRTVMVTAVGPNAGATTVAAGLARALTRGQDARTLLVDANARAPGLRGRFALNGGPGLGDMLTAGVPLETCLNETVPRGLSILTAGRFFPVDLLASPAFEQLLATARARYRFTVLDAAPLPQAMDACLLARQVDGVILVVDATRTSASDAREAVSALDEASGHVLGVVLNRQRRTLPALLQRALNGARTGPQV